MKNMTKITVCLLTYNSMRTLPSCLPPAMSIADEIVVVDSGSSDGSLRLLDEAGVTATHRAYASHGDQMNFAIDLASNDWVFCLDSDEYLDEETIKAVRELKQTLDDPTVGYRIQRYWRVLGQEVRAIYPVSSPDRPLRLFNRTRVRFNDQPVDDKASGAKKRIVLPGHVVHDTFFSMHEVFSKLNGYTTRLVRHQKTPPRLSLWRAFLAPPFAFIKWYLRKSAWRDGAVGLVTAIYASLYTFLKYLKAWCHSRKVPL